ncbi:hypothetical protein M405DRAFT_938077 [Rhizopogon salebrosus TDB-379]|nr:hypothetical protein M405DRAFT_938077 [Rhizopogon salebrosus TDB-379]
MEYRSTAFLLDAGCTVDLKTSSVRRGQHSICLAVSEDNGSTNLSSVQTDRQDYYDALSYDKATHNFDLSPTCAKLKLDLKLHQRIRLINCIGESPLTPEAIENLTGSESFLTSDDYLIRVIEDDPLLQSEADNWSDEEDFSAAMNNPHLPPIYPLSFDMAEYRALVGQRFDAGRSAKIVNEPGPPPSAGPTQRDYDTHYFSTIAQTVHIHAVMIQDKVRTSTYASFVLTNPILFRDAIVLDVGCGIGILSLLATKSRTKNVYAVDASDIAEKAEQIVRVNGREIVIMVIRGESLCGHCVLLDERSELVTRRSASRTTWRTGCVSFICCVSVQDTRRYERHISTGSRRLPIRNERHSRETPTTTDARHGVAGRLQLLRNCWTVLPSTIILYQV